MNQKQPMQNMEDGKLLCYSCKHRRTIPGDTHTRCVKPDPLMQGTEYGIRSGWFFYPLNFDPVWMAKKCSNYEKIIK